MKNTLAVAWIALAAFTQVACADLEYSCTDDLRIYDIVVQRPLNVTAEQIDTLVFETCIDSVCRNTSTQNGEFDETYAPDALSGAVHKNATGYYLDGRLTLGERDGTTQVRLRATLPDGTEVLTVEGDVSWRDLGEHDCHTEPTRDRL